ncbi:MAG: hypothetical protein IT318_18115 [Anaerolineales bacterium]|nr:hypothetical protein [Anaerolineales bacterium]
MTATLAGLPLRGRHRALYLYEQSAGEARLVRQFALRLRAARTAARLTRQQLATNLGVELAVVAAVENGFGSAAIAGPLVEAATALSARLAEARD